MQISERQIDSPLEPCYLLKHIGFFFFFLAHSELTYIDKVNQSQHSYEAGISILSESGAPQNTDSVFI